MKKIYCTTQSFDTHGLYVWFNLEKENDGEPSYYQSHT